MRPATTEHLPWPKQPRPLIYCNSSISSPSNSATSQTSSYHPLTTAWCFGVAALPTSYPGTHLQLHNWTPCPTRPGDTPRTYNSGGTSSGWTLSRHARPRHARGTLSASMPLSMQPSSSTMLPPPQPFSQHNKIIIHTQPYSSLQTTSHPRHESAREPNNPQQGRPSASSNAPS